MKWVVIIKLNDGRKACSIYDNFEDAMNDLVKANYDSPYMGLYPVKVTIEKVVMIDDRQT